MDDVINIVPQVMILSDVTSETALCTLIESKPIKATNETYVCHVFIAELLLVT
jgi:hypothetical protein